MEDTQAQGEHKAHNVAHTSLYQAGVDASQMHL